MTRSVDQVNAALYDVRRMPYGLARSTAAAAEVERVEAEGPDGARAYALFVLVESFVWGGEVTKAYLPFTKMLRWWDEHPEHFDAEDAHSLFWSFKWMVGHLMEFPTVPAVQIERTLDDMARRYALAGNGTNAVELERFEWARERGGADVEDAYRAWVATPRDEYSQCEACEPGDRAAYLFETGRHEEGIRLLEQVLQGSPSCATEPGDMLSHLQLAYVEVGDAEAAARTHRRGLRHLDTGVSMTGPKGRHVEFLARTGNASRALRLLGEHQAFLTEADSPGDRLGFLTSVSVATGVLRAEHADAPLALRDVPAATVAELDDWARREAADLAGSFDARNGTHAASERLRAAWDHGSRSLPVDLSILSTAPEPAAGAPNRATPSPTGGATGADLGSAALGTEHGTEHGAERPGHVTADPVDAEGLLVLADDVADEDPVRAAQLLRRASALLESAGHLDRAGFALAEAAQLAAVEGDDEGAAPAFVHALALVRAGGVAPRFVGPVVRAYARLEAGRGDVTGALAQLQRTLDDLDAAGTDVADQVPRAADLVERDAAADGKERRDLRDTRARLLATAGELDAAATLAEAVAEEFARAGQVGDAAHAFWLAGRSRCEADADAEAVGLLESAMEGFAIVHDRDARTLVANELVATLRRLGREQDAAAVGAGLSE
jgi:tetratricopeptide (TPR) repeat protein